MTIDEIRKRIQDAEDSIAKHERLIREAQQNARKVSQDGAAEIFKLTGQLTVLKEWLEASVGKTIGSPKE